MKQRVKICMFVLFVCGNIRGEYIIIFKAYSVEISNAPLDNGLTSNAPLDMID